MKDELAAICANVQYNNNCNDEIFDIVNSLYGFEKANKIVLALDDNDVCPNCIFYDLHFSSGVERDEPLCSNQKSCCCSNNVTRDFGCKFFEPTDSIKETIRPIDMAKAWGKPSNKFGELIYSAQRNSDYTISLYTGGGDKLPTCTLCGATMHSFYSCSNKNCLQHKDLV